MKKKILSILGILAFISGYSNNNDCKDYKSTFQGHAAPKDQMQKIYNHPARIDVKNSWDCCISGSYIYWQPREDGLEPAKEVHQPRIPGKDIENDTLIHMDLDYHCGFKVGMGGNFERDDWSVDFEYTRLYTTNNRNEILSRELEDLEKKHLTPFWDGSFTSEDAFFAKAKWKLHFNIIDGVLGRSFYVGRSLIFKPFVGLRGGWIDQRYRVNYAFNIVDVDIFSETRSKSNSWIFGTRIGLDANWHLGEGFKLFGKTAITLFYQHFKTRVNIAIEDQETVDDYFLTMKEKEGYFNPNFEISLGLAWGSYFSNDNGHIDLLASYEFHIFWYQNMMRKMVDYTFANADPTPGDLVLHGLTVSLVLDF